MKFYKFRQNNSGGKFFYEKEKFSLTVIIEAPSANVANAIAEDKGLYFDGDGDCPCCGNRWYPVDEYHGTDEISQDIETEKWYFEQFDNNPLTIIHYIDGTVKEIV